MTYAKRLADRLRAEGLNVTAVKADIDESLDAEIQIDKDVYVQVGSSYVIVNRWIESERAFVDGPERRINTPYATILNDIREAMRGAAEPSKPVG